jgi:hypothetical protein
VPRNSKSKGLTPIRFLGIELNDASGKSYRIFHLFTCSTLLKSSPNDLELLMVNREPRYSAKYRLAIDRSVIIFSRTEGT